MASFLAQIPLAAFHFSHHVAYIALAGSFLLVVVGVVVLLPTIKGRSPVRWVGFDGRGINPSLWGELELRNQYLARSALYDDLMRLWDWKRAGGVTVAILRREADAIAGHLTAHHYYKPAERFVVRLNDDATPEAVEKRLDELERELHSLLLRGWAWADAAT